jgi:hypothetical protein
MCCVSLGLRVFIICAEGLQQHIQQVFLGASACAQVSPHMLWGLWLYRRVRSTCKLHTPASLCLPYVRCCFSGVLQWSVQCHTICVNTRCPDQAVRIDAASRLPA